MGMNKDGQFTASYSLLAILTLLMPQYIHIHIYRLEYFFPPVYLPYMVSGGTIDKKLVLPHLDKNYICKLP
jgi:hypothetical protein